MEQDDVLRGDSEQSGKGALSSENGSGTEGSLDNFQIK
jgi:hypothetical protein